MLIKNFELFCESYLSGSRQPLFHYTNSLKAIIETDTLKIQKPSFSEDGVNSISLTRTEVYNDKSGGCRFVLDTDALIRDGYKPIPVDEVGIAAKMGNIKLKDELKKAAHIVRHTASNIVFDDKNKKHPKFKRMEYDFEERIYKDIKNLGKYILYIDFYHQSYIDKYKKLLLGYKEKYPQIKFRIMDYSEKHFRQPKEVEL